MEGHDQIAIVIAALNAFEPSRDDTDNLYRLSRVFEGFRSVPDRDRVASAVFSLLERFPDAQMAIRATRSAGTPSRFRTDA
jgi:hypothetical protein